MSSLSSDLFQHGGISGFGTRLRRGEITAEAATRSCLQRISALNPKLGAFVCIAEDSALETARGIDRLLSGGTDLGPLMGIPVAVKDLFSVEGMPTRAGSNMEVSDLIGAEGSFIKALKHSGCVILGKTRTTEFAAGAQNVVHPTPWNPWDAGEQRTPGGSSSGSAVAQAAGLCGFAVGSDTGGSVRLPAALCGLFGLKTSIGLWSTDGVFPLCPAMDTIGLLTNSAADAASIFGVLTNKPVPSAWSLKGLRMGKPKDFFFEDLAPEVRKCVDNAMARLQGAGVELIGLEFPEVEEVAEFYSKMVPADLVATLGIKRVRKGMELLDPVVAERISGALDMKAVDYIRLARRQKELEAIGHRRMEGLEAWIAPTSPTLPLPVASCKSAENAALFTSRALRNTRIGNMYGFCASTIPIHGLGANLPVGIQIHCRAGQEALLLSISLGIENLIGLPAKPNTAGLV